MLLSIIIKYAWICLNKQCSECALGSKHFKILNMAVFSRCKRYTAFWVSQSMPWQSSKYMLVSKYFGILNKRGL